jgi:hypothetical protein
MNRRFICASVLSLAFFIGIPPVCSAGEIRLMFPKIDVEERKSAGVNTYIVYDKKEQFGKNEYLEKGLSEFVKEMENPGYDVDQIELWVEGREESGGVTRLFISMEEGRGYRLILKPKNR